MEFTEYDTRLAAYAVVVADGRILLSWWNGEGVGTPAWSLPGGGVEFAETTEQGAVRECLEETGYRVRLGQPLVVDTYTLAAERRINPVRGRAAKHVRVVYVGTVIGGTLGTLEVDGSTDRAEWVRLDEVADQPHVPLVDVALAAWRRQNS